MKKEKYRYLDLLKRVNSTLNNYKKVVYYEGMEFNSRMKWWPDDGVRPTMHEGVDICYVLSGDYSVHQLPLSTRLPVIVSGEVVAICDDFLGRTVFVTVRREASKQLVTAYAHIIPREEIVIGKKLLAGDIIGAMADTTGRKNRMPSHLHLTFLEVSIDIVPAKFTWDLLCQRNEATLLDPMTFLVSNESELAGKNPLKLQWERAKGGKGNT